jgi:Ca2+-transporting ATPase
VIRDGAELRIASREVVRGDVLVLHEGDRISADAVLVQGQLRTDESLLTGEAAPQDKLAGDPALPMGEPGGAAASPFLFAGTVVTKGVGIARVRATGSRSAIGRIGVALAGTREGSSRLQLGSRRIVRLLASIGLALAVALVLLGWLWDGRSLLDSLLLGIALAMAILPEEIPVVLTVFLALGAWRLSRQQVLTRRVAAVEALGAITVLAVDKTGTLTQNRMEVAELWVPDQGFRDDNGAPLAEEFHEAAEFALLATPPDPFDPMEKAIREFGLRHLRGTEHVHAGWQPEQQYPLTAEILAMTRVFALDRPQAHLLATKGAPEAVADLCHLDAAAIAAIRLQVDAMAGRGLRVLGVAKGHWDGSEWPASQHDFSFRFLGLVGLLDPPRPQAAAAVAACARAGIRVIMMTGDHPATAQAIARQVGLAERGPVLTGASRAHKLRLVRALQAAGESVGMTGDGVNDAPALKAADVGIAMGERGTDVAREAAAIVLLDDSFASITAAIRQGRQIDDNLRNAMRFVFAVHVPVIALALVPVLLHWPVLLLPAQIVVLQLIIDPACSVLFEAEPALAGVMERPPRPATDSPFALPNLAHGVLQGVGLAVILLVGAALMVQRGWPPHAVRTTVFLALVAGVFLLVLAYRGRRGVATLAGNPWLPRLLLAVAAVLALVLGLPWLRAIMGFEPPSVPTLVAALAMLAAVVVWNALLGRLVAAAQPVLARRHRERRS